MPNIIPGDGTHGDIPLYNLTYTVVEKEYGRAAVQNRHLEQFDFMYSEPIRLEHRTGLGGEFEVNIPYTNGPETGGFWAQADTLWLVPYRGYVLRPQIRIQVADINMLSTDNRGVKFILNAICSADGATSYSYTKTYTNDDIDSWEQDTWLRIVCDELPSDWPDLVDGDGTDDIRFALEMQHKDTHVAPVNGDITWRSPTIYLTREEFTRTY